MDSRTTVEAMLRADLRGRTAYGAPQLDVPVALNTNENSYPVPAVVVEAMTKAVAAAASGLNRYPIASSRPCVRRWPRTCPVRAP
jgi:histidinol-phosphate aminotransferase